MREVRKVSKDLMYRVKRPTIIGESDVSPLCVLAEQAL